ncbi:MAG: hypothetical protein HZA15_03645 [Nitrospirae bacterium]|nr:hypothetical protein [Nitrospirota bacterium]
MKKIIQVGLLLLPFLLVGPYLFRYTFNFGNMFLHAFFPNKLYELDCRLSNDEAILNANTFLRKVNIDFNFEPVIKAGSNLDYPGSRIAKGLIFEYPDGGMRGRIYVGCDSHEVEYFNYFEGRRQNDKSSRSEGGLNIRQSLLSIAEKIQIPSDMVIDRIEKEKGEGIWNAYFIRKRNGYNYQFDKIKIGVWDKTGEIAFYSKVYMGTECSTEVKIKEHEALQSAWNIFTKLIFGEVYKQADSLYGARAKLLIIQPDHPRHPTEGDKLIGPTTQRSSRLAWVISIYFTGGVILPDKPYDELSYEEKNEATIKEWKLWRQWGNPLRSFHVRIDAETGELLYAEHIPLLIANLLK